MGAGIAQTAIAGGYEVTIREVDDASLTKGMESIKTRLERLVQKGELDPTARRQPRRELQRIAQPARTREPSRRSCPNLGIRPVHLLVGT